MLTAENSRSNIHISIHLFARLAENHLKLDIKVHENSMNFRPHVGPFEEMSTNVTLEESEFDSDPKVVYILAGLLCLNCLLSLFGGY